MDLDKLVKKQQEYWTNRNEKAFLNGENEILLDLQKLQVQYEKAIKQIEAELNIFYGKYRIETNIDISESKKLLNKTELKSFKEDLKEFLAYAKNNKLDNNYIQKLRLLEYKSKVSRLEELKEKIQFEIEKLTGKATETTQNILTTTYENNYYESIYNTQHFLGFGTSFTQLNKKAIEKAIKTNYMTENYNDVLWKNKQSLLNILNQQIPQGIILGYNPKKVAMIAEKRLKTNYNSTVRLIRTEYNLILNDATYQGYKECSIEKYQILATLDNRTSEICQEMDGKIFDFNKKEVGINYPPFHPNCRTTTIPYFEPDEFSQLETRIAKDEDGKYYQVPANLTYKQWKEQYQINL